jgi:hypothetical protein
VKVQHFTPELFHMRTGSIQGLNFRVYGKCDTKWNNLWLWYNYEFFEFCIVRHLLIYVYLAKIQTGSLFPAIYELLNPPANGHFESEYAYSTFMTELKDIFNSLGVLAKKGGKLCSDGVLQGVRIGTHCLRKTAHLIAIFGGAHALDLYKSARHSSLKSSFRYTQSAESQKISYDRLHDDKGENLVHQFMAINCLETDTSAGMPPGLAHLTSLPKVALWYVREHLKVPADHEFAWDARFLLKLAKEDTNTTNHDKNMDDFLSSIMPAGATPAERLVAKVRIQ